MQELTMLEGAEVEVADLLACCIASSEPEPPSLRQQLEALEAMAQTPVKMAPQAKQALPS
jgi:hypothetical protein